MVVHGFGRKITIDVILESGEVAKGVADLDGKIKGLGGSGQKASLGIGKIVTALGLTALASKGIDMVKQSLDGAINRYDTLNQFPRVLQMMGFDAQESQGAIDKLSQGIDGLPTPLDAVAKTAQGIALMTGDLDGAVDTTLALNNAFLASGSSTADAERGLQQYVQMLSKGEVDLQSWRTLQETMPIGLNRVAEAFGFTGKAAQNDLYAALKEGNVTFDEFNAKMIEMSTETGGFADIAQDASGGIKTSWANIKTALVKGVADVIGAIDEALGGVGSIESMLDTFKGAIRSAFSTVVEWVPLVVNGFKIIYDILQPWLPLLSAIVAGIGAVVTAYASFNTVKSIIDAVKNSQLALNLAVLANPWALGAAAIIAALILAYNKVEWFRDGVDAAFSAVTNFFKKFMGDAIEPVERFGEGVSESTQKAVGAFMDMSEKADVALKEVVWSQKEMNEEMATNMVEGQQEITDTLLSAIGDRHEQEKAATTEQFAQLESLTDEQRASILEATDAHYAKESVAVETGNAAIAEIIQVASDEKRALTQAESDTILQIREGMTTQAVAVMSESEAEQKLIYEKMKDNASTISALEAAEVVKNSVKKKEEVIDEAETQFTETRLWAEKQRDELGTLSEEEAQAVIDEAKKKRDDSVAAAEDMHQNVVKEAKAQANEHVNEVDWSTGEIKSKWEIMKSDLSKKMKEIGKDIKDGWTKAKEDASNKVEEMKTAVREKFEEIKTAVSTKMEEAKTTITTKWEEAVTFLRGIDLVQIGKDIIQGLIDGIGAKFEAVKKKVSELAEALPDWMKTILGIRSPSRVFEGIGIDSMRGLENGLANQGKKAVGAVKKVSDSMAKSAKNLPDTFRSIGETPIGRDDEEAPGIVEGVLKIFLHFAETGERLLV